MPLETYEILGVPIFAVGIWNGDPYQEADLDHMVAAFNQVGFSPPMKLGHDESQQLAKNDGMPAVGWVTNLRRAGTQLYCDIKDLPKRVYEAIKRKNYNRVSAEVYWDYNCNGKKYPRVLKALSLLGADIPAVTSLTALEQLYDGEGQEFKRYDMGMFPSMVDSSTPPCGPPIEQPVPLKAKLIVGYREAEAGGLTRCGACKYFRGPADPTGEEMYIGSCSIVIGEVASSWVCDLWEAREAFSSMSQYDKMKDHMIEQRGKKWVLISKSSGEVLGEHDSEEDAMAQEQAIQMKKMKSKMNTQSEGMKDPDDQVGDSAPAEGAKEMAEQTATIEALHAQIAELTKKNEEAEGRIKVAETRVSEFSQSVSEKDQRLATLETEKAELAERTRQTEKQAWFSALTSESNLKILPVEKPIVEHLYDQFSGGVVKSYSDNGKEVSNLDALKMLFESRKPGTFLFKELSAGTSTVTAGSPDTKELMSPAEAKLKATQKAKQYMQEKNEKVFAVALKAVFDADPDLKSMAAGITPRGAAKADAGQAHMGRMFRE